MKAPLFPQLEHLGRFYSKLRNQKPFHYILISHSFLVSFWFHFEDILVHFTSTLYCGFNLLKTLLFIHFLGLFNPVSNLPTFWSSLCLFARINIFTCQLINVARCVNLPYSFCDTFTCSTFCFR